MESKPTFNPEETYVLEDDELDSMTLTTVLDEVSDTLNEAPEADTNQAMDDGEPNPVDSTAELIAPELRIPEPDED